MIVTTRGKQFALKQCAFNCVRRKGQILTYTTHNANSKKVNENNKNLIELLKQLKKNFKIDTPTPSRLNTDIFTNTNTSVKVPNEFTPKPFKYDLQLELEKKLNALVDQIFPKTKREKGSVREGLLKLIKSQYIEQGIFSENILLNKKAKGIFAKKTKLAAKDVTNTEFAIFQDFLTTIYESSLINSHQIENPNFFIETFLNGKDLVKDKEFFQFVTRNLYQLLDKAFDIDMILFKKITKRYLNTLFEINRINLVSENDKSRELLNILSNPVHWYPETRLYKRKIVLHIGPTNSGKTYNAIERLKSAKGRSFYAGPLRLLAKEVYDRFNHSFKIPCNLTTGESIIEKIDPATGRVSHISSGTTELLAKQIQSGMEYDVVVLDEIQNIGLKERGFAWSDILLGCKAKELHLCGEPRVVEIIKKICEITKDELVNKNYTRLSNLTMEAQPLKNWSELRSGDCIIESSRRKIIALKLEIERETEHTVSVVYGGLPLEARLQQSFMFNSRSSTILVASNAVGVGLNLNIERIVFNNIQRTDGTGMVLFDSSEIRQIAGRAGRHNTNGFVTSVVSKNVDRDAINNFKHIGKTLKEENPPIDTVYVFPPMSIISKLYDIFEERYKYGLGAKFKDRNEKYLVFFKFLSANVLKKKQDTEPVFKYGIENAVGKNQLPKLEVLCRLNNLTFYDILMLMNAPLKFQYKIESDFFTQCTMAINDNKTVSIFSLGLPTNILKLFVTYPIDDQELYNTMINSIEGAKILGKSANLEVIEQLYRCLVLFCWLQNRYPNNFLDVETVLKLQKRCELIIFYKLSVEPFYKLDTRVEIKNRIIKHQQERAKIRQINGSRTKKLLQN